MHKTQMINLKIKNNYILMSKMMMKIKNNHLISQIIEFKNSKFSILIDY